MKKLITLVGTRPEIIKMSSLIPQFDSGFDHVLVHSGQHYSPEMDALFFKELGLRAPDVNLRVGSKLPGHQIADILERFEKVLLELRPEAVVVQGDTNTTVAGALAASKHRDAGIRLIHVEAGARSHLPYQPEEMNRRIVDQISDLLFAPYESDRENLLKEGIDDGRIRVVGNTAVDSCRRMEAMLDGYSEALNQGLDPGAYILATFHRQETVDDEITLRSICDSINDISTEIKLIIPVHPRTRKMLARYGLRLDSQEISLVDPLAYRSTVSLLKDSRLCITDSGGIQEEAAVLGVPTLVIRENTEHIRYVHAGMHEIVGTARRRITEAATLLLTDQDEYERRRNAKVSFIENTTTRIVKEITTFLR